MKFNKSILTVATLSLMLSACVTTPEDPNAKAKKGALIGAATGAAAGYLIGRDTKGALIGAAVGTAAGAGIGHYQDKQEAELRKQLQGSGVDVVRDGDNIVLEMPSGITFGFNSSDVNSQFYPVLDRVANTLVQYNQTIVNVAGHTDSVGSDSYNMNLSKERADSVAQYLQSRGVNGQRLNTVGYGESRPVDTNNTEAGRANNRRVEITLVPMSQ
jgi:outer membrane protein OmpA-like peptidoglycan-associated protein